MIVQGDRVVSCRPGRMSSQEDSEDAQREKQSNLERYVERIRCGLPLFEGCRGDKDVGTGSPGMTF